MKRIGILGGMSPESTIDYYNEIIHGYIERYGDHHYPEIIIFSVSFGELLPFMEAKDWDGIGEKLAASAQILEAGGADFIIIATNTMHKVVDRIREAITIPVISLLDVLGQELNTRGIQTVGLLGTAYTMEDGFYQKALEQYGIRVCVPEENDRTYVNQVIFSELIAGILTDQSKQEYIRIINQLIKEQQVEGIILGCTEIPLLIKEQDVSVPVLNTTCLHALASLHYAMQS